MHFYKSIFYILQVCGIRQSRCREIYAPRVAASIRSLSSLMLQGTWGDACPLLLQRLFWKARGWKYSGVNKFVWLVHSTDRSISTRSNCAGGVMSTPREDLSTSELPQKCSTNASVVCFPSELAVVVKPWCASHVTRVSLPSIPTPDLRLSLNVCVSSVIMDLVSSVIWSASLIV